MQWTLSDSTAAVAIGQHDIYTVALDYSTLCMPFPTFILDFGYIGLSLSYFSLYPLSSLSFAPPV